MRKAFVVGALLVAAARSAAGGDLFGGYSSLRSAGDNVRGAGLGFTWRGARPLRFSAELTGQFGRAAGEDLTAVALLAGTSYAPWRARRLRPFVQLKAGPLVSRSQVEVFGVAIGPDGVCDGGCPWQIGLAAEAGGGLDLQVTDRLALRLPQADYRFSRVAGHTERGLRLSAGLVYRWPRP